MLASVLSAHPIKNMTYSDPGEWLGQVAGIAKRHGLQKFLSDGGFW
jgi:hypothetical protein